MELDVKPSLAALNDSGIIGRLYTSTPPPAAGFEPAFGSISIPL